nr:hypothetical protein [uncultured Cohaesibacter sp.]
MMPRNLFQEALASAKARGCTPDKWVVNSHVVTALVENRRNSSVNYIDVVNIKEQTMEILGLPVRMSTKIDPMVVMLAEGKRGLSSFTIPLVLDLTELGPIG